MWVSYTLCVSFGVVRARWVLVCVSGVCVCFGLGIGCQCLFRAHCVCEWVCCARSGCQCLFLWPCECVFLWPCFPVSQVSQWKCSLWGIKVKLWISDNNLKCASLPNVAVACTPGCLLLVSVLLLSLCHLLHLCFVLVSGPQLKAQSVNPT